MKKICPILIVCLLCVFILQQTESVAITETLYGRVIVLDPGHGGLDNGASVGSTKEDELNLKICFALKEELEAKGATVYLTRTDDNDMTNRTYNYSKQDDMYLRVMKIDEYKPDLFLSIHLNSSTSSAWGSQVFYYKNSEEGKRLAEYIHEAMKPVTGTRKQISTCSFYVVRATQSLGVLVECGFISNANERGQLKSAKYQKKLAVSMTEGIEKYLNSFETSY